MSTQGPPKRMPDPATTVTTPAGTFGAIQTSSSVYPTVAHIQPIRDHSEFAKQSQAREALACRLSQYKYDLDASGDSIDFFSTVVHAINLAEKAYKSCKSKNGPAKSQAVTTFISEVFSDVAPHIVENLISGIVASPIKTDGHTTSRFRLCR